MNTWQIIIGFVCFVFIAKLLVTNRTSNGTERVQTVPQDEEMYDESSITSSHPET